MKNSPQPLDTALPSAGLEWACRLLFGYGTEDRAHVAVPGTSTAPARRPFTPAKAPDGYRLAESYLAVPRASDPRLLVPLGSAKAAAAVLARSHDASSRKSRAAKALLAAGLRAGVAQRVLPDRVDVAVATGVTATDLPSVLLSERLAQLFATDGLQMAVLLGPPRLNRKPVLQLLTPAGDVVGYVKAAWNELTSRLVGNEARVLGHYDRKPPKSFGAATVLHHGPWGDLELLATSALPNTGRPSAALAFDPPIAVIEEIASFEGHSRGRLADSPYWETVAARMAERAALLDGRADVLAPVVEHVERRYGRLELAFGSWHGDFTPWNMARLAEGTYVWDWERCAPAPLGLDLLHFLFQSVCRFEGRKPLQAVEICRERTPELLAMLHVLDGSEDALWSLYRLELLFRYEEAALYGLSVKDSRIHAGIVEMFTTEMEAV